jgi:hypothetical protein
MAATDLYLIRKNQQWVKFSAVLDLAVTGQTTAYGSITGVAGTDVVTIPGLTAIDGMGVTLTSLTGGAGLSTGVKYYLVNSSGSTAQLATSQGGTPENFTTNITAGTLLVSIDEILVWSGEYRDIFASAATIAASSVAGNISSPCTYSAPGMISSAAFVTTATIVPTTSTTNTFTPTAAASQSDETAHEPLRQTALKRTCWKFDYGAAATPRYGYAFVMDGDIIANNPPETV